MPRRRLDARPEPGTLASIHPLGAVGGVTGSCVLVATRRSRVLVDSGMFQGGRWADRANRARRLFTPRDIDAVVLTHAHLDHSGMLPRLVQEGLRATVHTSEGSAELLPIMLRDAAHIQEADAERDTRRARRRGGRASVPLYTRDDAEAALDLVQPGEFGERIRLTPDVDLVLHRAGHILGAAHAELLIRDKESGGRPRRVLFSGDIGRRGMPLVCDPEPPPARADTAGPDLVFCESTYGDREHQTTDATFTELEGILETSMARNGTVLIPVFAVGRAQEVLHALASVFARRPDLERPVALDSPMAISVTSLYRKHARCLGAAGRDAVEAAHSGRRGAFEPRTVEFTREPMESMALNRRNGLVILSAAGMCDAGRIVHHLKHRLWREDTDLVFVGFQAQGSVGRRIVDGERQVRILGETIRVNARIHTLGGYSAHAGRTGLLQWLDAAMTPGAQLVLNHGEDGPREALAEAVTAEGHGAPWRPMPGARIELPAGGGPARLWP